MICISSVLFLTCLYFSAGFSQEVPVWDCKSPLPPAPPASDVYHLRPQDIKAVMAVGDSISAGFAMRAPHAYDIVEFSKMLIEYRGDVFSIGGNEGQYTIANFIKKYNPMVQGASIGSSLPLDYVKWKNHDIQPFDPKVSHLNGAQSGARVEDVPAQIDYITQQLKTTYSKTVNFDEDWKILTILIGANNLCSACRNSSKSLPDFYYQQLNNVLTKVYQQIPRTFVNVMLMFNISQVWNVMETSEYCKVLVNHFTMGECGCLTDHSTPASRKAMDDTGAEYNKKIYQLEQEWSEKNLSTFRVVAQPFTSNMKLPDTRYLSDLDCFHPSLGANIGFSLGLWNNMLQPKSQKSHEVKPTDKFLCPNPDSYFS